MSKLDLAARVTQRLGADRWLRWLPAHPHLQVLTYHRVGDATACEFDEDLYSCSAEMFDRQMAWLAESWHVLTLEDLLRVADNGFGFDEPCVLITFDDGYRDNYEVAYPLLRRHGLSAVFFVPSQVLQQPVLPWWDQIAYLLKQTGRKRIGLSYPQRVEPRSKWSFRSEPGTALSGSIDARIWNYPTIHGVRRPERRRNPESQSQVISAITNP